MTNDELSEIDAEIASVEAGNGLVHFTKFWMVKLLRSQLSENAARAVTRDKRLADAERRVLELEAELARQEEIAYESRMGEDT